MTGPKERKQMKVGLAQVKPIKADLSTNIARIKMMIAEAVDDIDLMVFSETNLSGYFVRFRYKVIICKLIRHFIWECISY